MKTWMKVAIVTAIVAVPAFVSGPILFPPADTGVEPTAGQMPFFLFLAVGDAVLLGLGVSFVLFGLSVIRRGVPRLEAEGVGDVSLHRLPDDLVVAPPQHARPQRDGPARAPDHRLLVPPASGSCRRGPGPLLHLPVQELQERKRFSYDGAGEVSSGSPDGGLSCVRQPGKQYTSRRF